MRRVFYTPGKCTLLEFSGFILIPRNCTHDLFEKYSVLQSDQIIMHTSSLTQIRHSNPNINIFCTYPARSLLIKRDRQHRMSDSRARFDRKTNEISQSQ
jgi:hypothetical protein